jgi:hypothetical protein
METIYVLTEEWYDIIYLENNYAVRHLNKDKGTFTKNNNLLIISWNKWGDEFFTNFNNIYYKLDKKDFIKIYVETDDIIDYAILYPSKKIIQFVNYNLEGMFYFDKLILKIKINNINHYETFYSMNYGRYFSSAERIKNNPDKDIKDIKNIAILFPQFHEFEENNKFWGNGFTEWTLLKKMPKIVDGQIIKHPINEMGYYDLKNIEHRIFIESLAKHYNIHGFCYYHYWFKNKKVMYEPLELMLKDGRPNIKFMFCWANEQWTKKWDGGNNDILLEQDYSDVSGNENHFFYLLDFFKHKNYIKIENKPVFIFYRIEQKDKTHIESIIKLWDDLSKKNGFSGIYFMRFLGPFDNSIKIDGIQSYVNFEPGNITKNYYNDIISYDENNKIFENNVYDEETYLNKNIDLKESIKNNLFKSGYEHYDKIKGYQEEKVRTSKFFINDGNIALNKIIEQEKLFERQHFGIFCGWNNSPRRNFTSNNYGAYPLYYKNINYKNFGETYYNLLKKINNSPNKGVDFLFISAWNEWNEQAILEPNNYDGYDYLNILSEKYIDFYKKDKNKNILNICHKGGGTEKYINDLIKIFPLYNFIYFENYDSSKNYEKIYTNIDFIHINSCYNNNLINNYIDFFRNYFTKTKKIITMHDYQWLYPDDPNILTYNFRKETIQQHLIDNILELFSMCTYIIFPSYNILKNYNEILKLGKFNDKIKVIFHNDLLIYNDNFYIPSINNIINICFIGNFIKHKGSEIFKNIYEKYKNFKNYKIQYNVFGYLSDNEKNNMIQDENFIYHNTYKENELISILYKNNIHGITHLSLFEESYCYALTTSINSGIPILYLEHGAFTERLIDNNKYYPTNLSNFNTNFELFLNYIIDNQNTMNIEKINYNLQPKKWYLTNYY